ncbi:hypothetical protein LPJ59_004034 [Coemansia sp. RSA 2399]|nr:hypothetical protein LPJ59_004034 [Coemansia sp. RSA 2399]KAJ1901603.1 hypothetical protein LPJ81_003728 [Coemansia sp. IMI 209127]
MSRWINAHPADYASVHYFHLVAEFACSVPNEGQDAEIDSNSPYRPKGSLLDIAQSELANNTLEIATVYAEYESVWYHRRWCISILARSDAAMLHAKETAFIDNVKSERSSSEIAIALATRHMAWIRRFVFVFLRK